MADKAITELVAAEKITATDMFVLEQDGTAKKLSGQVLLNWLTAAADGHGGIQDSELLKTEGLVKTYRFTLADQTYMDIDVVDGRGIESLKPTSTNGLEVTYTVTYNDGTTNTFTITNGAKGDKGDNANIWVRYASQQPTSSSHSFGEIPDAWIGISSGHLAEAPTDWQQYTWYQWKGEKGDPGDPATLASSQVTYQMGDSGTIIPSGTWSSSIPVVTPGKYLWTREITQFNTGDPITKYSVARFGIDGTGSVSSVADISPDENGNVPLTAKDVGALPDTGGDLTGELKMNGQPLSGLNAPATNDQAANKGYVDQQVKKAAPRNLLDNSDFTNPVNQRGSATYTGSKYTIDRWRLWNDEHSLTINDGHITVSGKLYQILENYKANTVYTLAVMSVDGTLTIRSHTFEEGDPDNYTTEFYLFDNSIRVRLESDSFVWAALYEGEYTAETLPEYQPKGYGAELAECQMYLRLYNAVFIGGMSYNPGNGYRFGNSITFDPMRIKPTVTGVVHNYYGTAYSFEFDIKNESVAIFVLSNNNSESTYAGMYINVTISADL